MANILKDMVILNEGPLPDLADLFASFDGLKAQLKADPDNDSLTSKFTEVAGLINAQASLIRLTPHTDRVLLEQLFRDEKVHPVGSFDEYIQTRIGMPGDHKSAFALAAQGKDGPRALAAIYTYYDSVACDPYGNVDPENLRGDIHAIKTEAPRALSDTDTVDVVYFYTVSSKIPRAAYTLIGKVGALHSGMLKSTVSPVREFTKSTDMDAFDALALADRKARVADYITTRDGFDEMDPVAFFHMDNGNGAYAGSIKFNPGAPDDRVMMNYIYTSDPSLALDNQRAFHAGYVTMARPLWNLLSDEKKRRVYAVDEALNVLPPPVIAS